MNFTDPSGHRVPNPVPGCTLYDADYNCMDGVHHGNGNHFNHPDSVNRDLLWDEWTSSHTKLSGEDYYNLYLDMWAEKDGWWWDTYGADGIYDIWDFGATMLYYEMDLMNDPNSTSESVFDQFYQGTVTTIYNWCVEMKCDPSTPEGMLNWLAGYVQTPRDRLNSYNAGTGTLIEIFEEKRFPTDRSLMIAQTIKDPEGMGHSDWTKLTGDLLVAPGNVSMNPTLYEKLLSLGLAKIIFGSGGSAVVLMTGCGYWAANGLEYPYNNNQCSPSWDDLNLP